MTNDDLSFIQKLKPYHIILFACILCPLLIINSNRVNEKRAKENLYKEKKKIFESIISTRKLDEDIDEDSTELSGIDQICERGSDDLKKYYVTGDLTEIGLKEEEGIKCEENEEEYFKSLIKIIKVATGTEEEDEKELRNLELSLSDIQDDLINYLMHMLPVLIFLVIGILSLPGWPICCFCCCCNCCCCCCCKKPGCKIPCFIFTYIFYGLSVAICLYGLTQANKIFVGLADTECSMLRFFDQILEGEIKQTTPRWPGIKGIGDIIDDINTEVDKLRTGTLDTLKAEIGKIKDVKDTFLEQMKLSGEKFSSTEVINHYKKEYNFNTVRGRVIKGTFVLDLIKFFGHRENDKENYVPNNSILNAWQQEYDIVSQNADEYLKKASDIFETVSNDTSGDIIKSLNEAKDTLNEIKVNFNDIKSEIEGILVDYSELIDKYGKLGVKVVFGVLGLMNIALAVFILFICLCSGKMCTNCCCCRCIFKFFTHLLWNILAILTFVAFMVGFIFSFVGTLGYDVMSVVSYVLSKDNLGENGEGLLVDKLGDSKKYLDTCINGDGKILNLLDIDTSQLDSFDDMTGIEEQINTTKKEFEDKKIFVTYSIYKDQLNSRANLTSDELMLIEKDFNIDLTKVSDNNYKEDNKDKILIFKRELEAMNGWISAKGESERWERTSTDQSNVCNAGASNDIIADASKPFNFWKCKPLDRDWIFLIENNNDDIKAEATILTDTLDLIQKAKDDSPSNDKSFINALNNLKTPYENYLDQYIKALDGFQGILENITGKLKEYINKDEGLFSFIDGKFIKTNLKVMLKYLKLILGGNVKTIGLCLSIVGCSLALSISSTILLIVIINVDIDNNKKLEEEEKQNNIPEYQTNSGGRVIQYKNY